MPIEFWKLVLPTSAFKIDWVVTERHKPVCQDRSRTGLRAVAVQATALIGNFWREGGGVKM
jgi:hypothetical protein